MGVAGGAAGGGAPGGGAGGGMGGMRDMIGKMMNNPKAMEAFQKAQSNPKASFFDVTQNGMSAMSKYLDDPRDPGNHRGAQGLV
ncbi:unnamed protein product, partial [Ectocarpus sp. 12 AP-2014]